METTNFQQPKKNATLSAKIATNFPSLEQETRSHVDTDCASFHLNRKPQTLRTWACHENGLIRPRRINGRLSWSIADIKRILNGGE